jgi:hypothetical protein
MSNTGMIQRRQYSLFDTTVSVVLAVIFLIGVFLCVDMTLAKPVRVGSGVVLEKIYSPARSSVGVGLAYTKDGGSPVIASNSSAEQWLILVQSAQKTFSVLIDSNDWGQLSTGQSVSLVQKQGFVVKGRLTIKRQ